MPSEACSEELDALLAIFLDDIHVVQSQSEDVLVSMVLYPSTGDDTESKYVTLTLEIVLPSEYPDVVPKIKIRSPRGLSEEMLETLKDMMDRKCMEILGCSMIFELIDMAREFLTQNNRPASECPICLLSFHEADVFFRPSCFHHVHSFCLGKYLYSVSQNLANEDQLPNESVTLHCCPVCRNEFKEEIDIQKLLSAPPPAEDSQDVAVTPYVPEDWLDQRETLNRLFAKQKSQGGIIDLTEKDKKLLVISSPARNEVSEGGSGSSSGGSLEESTTTSSSLSSTQYDQGRSSSNGSNPRSQPQQHPSRNKQQQQHHHHHHYHHSKQPSRHHQPQNHSQPSFAGSSTNSSGSSTATESSRSQGHSKDTNSFPHYRHRRRK